MLWRRLIIKLSNTRKMSIFTQNINPITGATAWEEKDPDYEYYQEIARSAFADMLHDHERNYKYYLGLKAAIEKKRTVGEEVNVLDIGTGTGLLSMMAAQLGADTVVACETFKPMAQCAKKIIEKNDYYDKIKLVYKRSTKLTVGENGDLPKRANILVTEVFDTELIGEGALSTFKHAKEFLLEQNCIVVPSRATVWAQVVDSPLVQRWNRVNSIKDTRSKGNLIEAPKVTQNCSGASAVHDIQLSQLPQESFKLLTEPLPIFKFDWTGKIPLVFDENNVQRIKPASEGTAHAVFMWWDIDMDTEREVVLSCAPVWAHPDVREEIEKGVDLQTLADKIPWRDHWMQAVYYLPSDYPVRPGDEVYLSGSHDEYSFWFSLCSSPSAEESLKRPVCDCFVHIAFSRTRIGQWNDAERNSKYLNSLAQQVNGNSVVLCLTDSSLLGLSVAKLGVKKLYMLETNSLSRRTIELFIRENELDEELLRVVDSVENIPSVAEVTHVFAEPYNVSSILPWDNFHFWYLASKYSRDSRRIPRRGVIRAVAMEFKDLYKIRAPLGICEGFDLRIFDDLVQSSSNKVDSPVEAQPLWEYPGKALGLPFTIADFNFDKDVYEHPKYNFFEKIPFVTDGSCNGVAIWVDWHLDHETVVSTGPKKEIVPGERVSWDIYTRQGVHLLPNIRQVTNKSWLLPSFKFNPKDGTMAFNFKIRPN